MPRSLPELRIQKPRAPVHFKEKAAGIKGRVRGRNGEHLAGKVPYLGIERRERSGFRQACDVPLRRPPHLSEGSSYRNLPPCHRYFYNLGPLTAGDVRIEAGYLGAGHGIEGGYI